MFKNSKHALAMPALLAGLLLSGSALAEKPDNPGGGKGGGGGGDPVAGTIYYVDSGSALTLDADDGANVASRVAGEPSDALHDGFRWYLQIRDIAGETYPDDSQRQEVFAVRGDGNESFTAQISNNPLLKPDSVETYTVRWGTDASVVDGKVSYQATEFSGGSPDGGIYSVPIFFSDGTFSSGIETQVVSVGLVQGDDYLGGPNVITHDWSPDGSELAHDSLQGGGIATVSGGVSSYLTAGIRPTYAPDGSLIAFESGINLTVIEPSGAGETVLITGTDTRKSFDWPLFPQWSPDSAHLTYQRYKGRYRAMNDVKLDIYRVARDGSGVTGLTSGAWATPRAWLSE